MKLRILTALLLLPPAAYADTLYKCTDESGLVLYTNQKVNAKHCIVLSRDQPMSTFKAPKAKTATASPSDFPRVSSDQQKARDNDRRAILDQEFATEQKLLDEARKALAEQEASMPPADKLPGGKGASSLKNSRDKVALHERNIEALKKEISNLR